MFVVNSFTPEFIITILVLGFIEFFQFYSPAQLFSFVGMLVGVVCHWKVGNYIKEGGECGWRVCATFTYNKSHFKICTGLTLFAVY